MLLACASLLGALSGGQASAWEVDEIYQFTLLHTNDHHGRFWPNRHGEYGLAARKTLVDKIRAEVKAAGGHSLLLSGGDINTGVPESDLQDAEPDFKAMNMLGYDAMAVGNHEFDNELGVIRKQQDWADFPFLAANIYDESSGKRLFSPYQMFDVGELNVAVVGFTTEDTKKLGNPEFMGGISFTTPVAEAAKLVPELRKQADLVIAVTHMGHYQDAAYGINAPGDVTLARSVLGIDVTSRTTPTSCRHTNGENTWGARISCSGTVRCSCGTTG
jgi:5'-nucleotidase/UDP-sugar diphosphatase